MIYIQKEAEPQELINWKKNNSQKGYNDLSRTQKRILRNSLLKEQGYICCFCGCSIGELNEQQNNTVIQCVIKKGKKHNTRNAHIMPQSKNPRLSLDYNNICASCNSAIHNERHCDIAQENKILPITPLQQDCADYFLFRIDGTIIPNSNKTQNEQNNAQDTIDILNLNSNFLKLEREKIIKNFSNMVKSLSDEDIKNVIKNLSQKNSKGVYAPYFFVPLILFNYINNKLLSQE